MPALWAPDGAVAVHDHGEAAQAQGDNQDGNWVLVSSLGWWGPEEGLDSRCHVSIIWEDGLRRYCLLPMQEGGLQLYWLCVSILLREDGFLLN